ncbi:uncharacterized protein LOC123680429 [Harmonia axyridis]|uniref:uncharacterized protein LOC123680429 n=1 Tax=Harmonia axyridis TaxID=115357 RepID=UPI001E278527|nr:uncharacterized protein LOC123680429 [Harmonia axyridis]
MGFNCYTVNKFDTTEGTPNKWFKRSSYGLWYIRDSRNISGLVGIFFFFMMMIIFFSRTQTKHEEDVSAEEEINPLRSTRNFNVGVSQREFCSYEPEGVTCDNVDSTIMKEVQEEINNNFATYKIMTPSLSFTNVKDPVEVIHKGWLSEITVPLKSLTIQNTPLEEIQSASFTGPPFQKLEFLCLEYTGTVRFYKDSFDGLEKLINLSIRGPDCTLQSAEEETLVGLNSMATLQITSCNFSPQVLKNLTGGNKSLETMQILDIQMNGIGKLLDNTFSRFPNLQSLYLTGSTINEGIEPAAFQNIHPGQIYLETAKLTKLPKGIFVNMPKVRLYLSGNNWNCTCDFQWFQMLYNLNNSIVFGGSPLKCYHDNQYLDMSDFPFCDSTSTTSAAISTLSPTTQQPYTTSSVNPITLNPDDYDPIKCLAANRSSRVVRTTSTNTPTVIYLGKEYVKFSFAQLGDEPKYSVTIEKTLEKDFILIFIDQTGWILCLTDLHNNLTVETLDYGHSYIVCLLESLQYEVSPRNCQPLTVPKEWAKQSWITNELKLPVIISVCSGLIGILFIALCLMYIYVKRNPNLVYGKENVIVVERENSKKDTDQEQKYYQQHKYPPSLISWSDGYLTPKIYESVEEFSIPYIDQYPSDYLQRPRIFPPVISGRSKDLEKGAASEIYESVNVCPSPYYMNDDFAHSTYDSL